jgi:hypothetical protein
MENNKSILDFSSDTWEYVNWIKINKLSVEFIYIEGFVLKHPNSEFIYFGYNPNVSNIFEIEIKDINKMEPLDKVIQYYNQKFSLVGIYLSNKALIKSIELFSAGKIPKLIDFNNKLFGFEKSVNSSDSILIQGAEPNNDTREREKPEPKPSPSERPAPERNNGGGGVRG